jgi:hypothetical protein
MELVLKKTAKFLKTETNLAVDKIEPNRHINGFEIQYCFQIIYQCPTLVVQPNDFARPRFVRPTVDRSNLQ